MKNNEPKYKFHVKTWGGFYNEEHKLKHGLSDGDFLFDSEEEREEFITHRKELSASMDAKFVVFAKTEGYDCTTRVVLHRISRFKGEDVYTTRDLGINYPFDLAEYTLENKWYLGFNDYPFGDIDYDTDVVEVVAEWITGAFKVRQQ